MKKIILMILALISSNVATYFLTRNHSEYYGVKTTDIAYEEYEDTIVDGYIPENGVVPDGDAAIGIAKEVFEHLEYGNKYSIKSFDVYFDAENGNWVVDILLIIPFEGDTVIVIRKSDGQILGIAHYKF